MDDTRLLYLLLRRNVEDWGSEIFSTPARDGCKTFVGQNLHVETTDFSCVAQSCDELPPVHVINEPIYVCDLESPNLRQLQYVQSTCL